MSRERSRSEKSERGEEGERRRGKEKTDRLPFNSAEKDDHEQGSAIEEEGKGRVSSRSKESDSEHSLDSDRRLKDIPERTEAVRERREEVD